MIGVQAHASRSLVFAGILPLLPFSNSAAPEAQAVASRPSLPVLREIKDIRVLSLDESARGYPVVIRGTLTYFDGTSRRGMIVHDGKAGQFIVNDAVRSSIDRALKIHPGDLVEIEGITLRGGFAPNVRLSRIRKLGSGSLPPAKHVPYYALVTGRYDCDYVEIVGVGQRAWLAEPPARTMFLDVVVEGATVRASFIDYSSEDLTRFIDARVRLRGNVGALFGQSEQLRGVSLLGGRAADIMVEEPPPDPSSLPIRAVNSIYKYSSGDQIDRRIRVRGVVTYQSLGLPVSVRDFSAEATFRYVRHVVYVRDATSGVRIETEKEIPLRPGDLVDVVGFPTVTPTKPTLRSALITKVGSGSEPEPIPLSRNAPLAQENDAELVRIQGQLLGVVTRQTERVLVLKMEDTVFDAGIDITNASRKIDSIRPGSVVSVTGIYSLQWGPPSSFRLLMRSPSDVVLVAAAPWWTVRHTLVMAVIVALIAAAAVTWGRMIANKNVAIRQQYQAVLAERGRLARELHDTLEQGLAGIKLQLEAVSGSLDGTSPRAQKSLNVAREMLRYCLDEARRSVMDLRSQALESSDLGGALADVARQMTLGTAMTASVRIVGEPRRLDGTQEHHLLRIGMEALTNVVKHSAASAAEIELRFYSDATELVVRDDGRGFSIAVSESPDAHFGLKGIRERVDKLGGTLRIENRSAGGAELTVRVPLRAATRSHAARETGGDSHD